jgi:hypothetical protein
LQQPTRAGIRRPALFALTLCVLAAACYSSSYRKEIAANTALLSDLSDKLNDYCTAGFALSGRQVSSEEMGEFYYALKKARSWSAMSAGAGARPSYRAFTELLGAYEVFLRDADQYRLARDRSPARLAVLAQEHATVAARARAVLDALRGERD